MRAVIELPDPKPGLDAALAKQFADIQKSLMGLMEAKEQASEAMHRMMLASMAEQREDLLTALERLLAKLPAPSNGSSTALLSAIQGLKTTV